jgi:hypothetical protein
LYKSIKTITINKTTMPTQETKNIQDFLVKQGLMTQAQVNTGYGIMGPKTTAALNAYKAKMSSDIQAEAAKNPVIAPKLAQYKSFDEAWGSMGGDLSTFTDAYGQPFSAKDQAEAVARGTADVNPYYQAQQAKETADTQAALKQKQLDYQNYQATSGAQFEADKAKQDQSAADSGVLFSGGRAQKLATLQNAYTQDQDYKRASTENAIGNTMRDFQYKYGNENANKLSDVYKLGGNTYNAQTPTGGVTTNGLSSAYKVGDNAFQGTQINAAKAEAQKRAAGYLWNKGNKITSGGISNKY